MTWIGLDDTDSPRGGCTTFALTEVVRAALDAGFDLLGEPRLVRLNPNIPFKTRGNAALAARFGHGRGPGRTIGRFPEGPLRTYPRGAPLRPGEDARLFEVSWTAARGASRVGDEGTDPSLVLARRRLTPDLYWSAVQGLVEVPSVEKILNAAGAMYQSEGSAQGIVGAAAALAWPGAHPTWELIAYRAVDDPGAARRVDPRSVIRAASAFPELFLCQDPTTRRLLVTPHTRCPILFGLRATRPNRLPAAFRTVRSEPVERWAIFRTNQGTGDHLSRVPLGELGPFGSSVAVGRVAGPPLVRAGGHVAFPFRDEAGVEVTCVAFEPTKSLPRVAAHLVAGDRVRIWGGRAEDPVFRLEGLEVLATVPRISLGPNPTCPRCARRMESLGRGRGFRCRTDRIRLPLEARFSHPGTPGPMPGRYHPTPSARRHLHPRAPEGERGSETDVRWWLRSPRIDL